MSEAFNLLQMEDEVRRFLQKYAKNRYSKYKIAPLIAKKSLEMNHLYRAMGFENRIRMGRFMKLHFPRLFDMRPPDKLWKKFIYDSVGLIAPFCYTCTDQSNCFKCQLMG
ncbi:MAG: nitrogen fixation protein NifQ [Campylobacteraceae bacterium]|jgi:nitrogen fixation protein NifQ|nr:nitrogen fixation protein NifQ [Campylobacteraceae bacterium]